VTAVNSSVAEALRDRYLLERELGSGGMATVYLAEDLKHRRKVAVKVLRPELAASVGAERFLQEITTAARFQHPHILPLLDSGEANGFLYYVMPFVEGESLRRRLAQRGELPVHEAVKIMIEVCDALAYAHERGVVHRDIKPDNVLLSGRHALVTDFGVAKALSEATGRHQLTSAGVALGTPAYMAPEQAAGETNIDQRVDIYALGILGYELVSGRTPFVGRTSQEVLAAHVTQPPEPLCSRRPACPPGLEAVIMKCLAKRPADRWQSADELLSQLEPLATPSGGTTPTTTRPMKSVATEVGRAGSRRWLPVTAVIIVVAAVAALVLTRRPEEIRLGRRLQLTLSPGLEIDPSLSPDGKFLAFVAGPLGRTRLYVRQVEGGSPVAITPENTGFARMPRWSPDGQRLVFSSERGIAVLPALGGAPRMLVPLPPTAWLDAVWSPDGESIAYGLEDSVFILPVNGGTSRAVGRIAEVHSCSWSPDGRWIACASGNRQFVTNEDFGNIAASSIWVIPAAGGAPVRVSDEQSLNVSPVWLGARSLLYVSNREGGRDIYQVTLSRSGRPSGEAVRLTTGVNAASVSASADGRRLVYPGYVRTANVWSITIPPNGKAEMSRAEPVTTGNQEIEAFDVSADGRWLVFDSDRSGTQQLYRVPVQGGEVQQITNSQEPSMGPSISPDGREVAYHTFRNGLRQVFVMPTEGGTPFQVTHDSAQNRLAFWLPDGRSITYNIDAGMPSHASGIVSRDAQGRWGVPRLLLKGGDIAIPSPDGDKVLTLTKDGDLATLPVSGGTPKPVLRSPRARPVPGFIWAWSSDGRMIYYIGKSQAGDETGIWQVPATGGTPRLAVRFDEPSRYLVRPWIRVQGNRIYFTRGDFQSDVWMTEISGSR
jgi:Tol biopolymer transport system component/tRNA A-37 threonylcarbamoyl transferase component Bud32